MSLAAWQALRDHFQRWTGVVLPETIRATGLELLNRLAGDAHRDPLVYLRMVDGDLTARQVILDQIGLGTTWFMRDEDGLRGLVRALLHRSASGQTVHLWSVGCSTGEEVYSLAMLLRAAGMSARILGTDLNQLAIRRAEEGRYPVRSLRRVPALWRARFFDEVEPGVVRVTEELRAQVSFKLHNVVDDDVPALWPHFDAVVCRNVLLYFERERALAIIDRLARACRPGGYLLLGAIERPLFWMSKLATREQAAELVQLAAEQPASRITQRNLQRARRPSTVEREARAEREVRPERPATGGQDPALMSLLDRADAAEKQGRLDNALMHIDMCIASAPLWAPAHLSRGLVLKHAGRVHEAIDALRVSRFLDSHAWLAPYQLALCLEAAGDPEDAIEAYRHALGVLETQGKSGLYRASSEVDSLARTAAEVCRERIRALDAST